MTKIYIKKIPHTLNLLTDDDSIIIAMKRKKNYVGGSNFSNYLTF